MNNKQESRVFSNSNHPVTFVGSTAVALTASDSATFEQGYIFVGTGGNLNVILVGDTSPVVLSNVPDGTLLPLLVKAVYDTDTTASNLVLVR